MELRCAALEAISVAEQMTLVVKGNLLRLSWHDVESCARGLNLETIQRQAVEVGGTKYPIKQVLEAATGLNRLDDTCVVARRNVGRLGFVLV